MKRQTTLFVIARAILSFAAAAFLVTSAAAQERLDPETVQMLAARQAELVEVERLLFDPAADGRQGAIQTLVHLASGYPVLPADVHALLIRANGDADPKIALVAQRALFNLEHPREDPDAEVPELVRMERSRRRELDQARAILADGSRADSNRRRGAVQTLVHLASLGSVAAAISEEVTELLRHLETDTDISVAHFAARTLAHREGRAMEPAFVPPVEPHQPSPDRPSQGPDLFTGLSAGRPSARLAALELILESALHDNRREDPKVLDAFVHLLADPDPRIAYRAGNALLGLAGDDNALADTYVGQGPDNQSAPRPRPAEPAGFAPPPNIGQIDAHGVFIGAAPERLAGEPEGESRPATPAADRAWVVSRVGRVIGCGGRNRCR